MADELTIGAGLRAVIVGSTLVAGRVWRSDKVPRRQTPAFPYVSFLDMLTSTPVLSGDCQTIARARLAQVDLWQKEADEDYLLAERLAEVIDGASIQAAQHVFGCKVSDIQRLDDPTPRIVHHALTVRAIHAAAITANP